MALLYGSWSRRGRSRNMAAVSAESGDVLRSRRVETRGRVDLGDRLVRPGGQPDLLGRRQRRTRLERGPASRRQLVYGFSRRARRRHREARWHYQFTPHDRYDYDAVQVPVLADINWNGGPVKAMLWANRNGNFYVLDRITGRFLMGKAFVKVNWLSGFDERGRPIQTPQPAGMPTWPGNQGGTNWYSPSFSPRTGLFYVSAWEDYATIFAGVPVEYQEGRQFGGNASRPFVAVPGAPAVAGGRRGPVNNWTEAAGHGAVIAIDPENGAHKWKFTHDRRDDRRHSDDCGGRAVHGQQRRLFPGAQRAHGRASLEGEPGRADRERARSPIRWTASSMSRWSRVCRS